MSQKQKSGYCPHCDRRMLAIGNKPNHLLHFFLTLFTLGLWLLVWLLVTIGSVGGYRCTHCGTSV